MGHFVNPLLKSTHHFGIGNVSKGREVCFVRISKNASSFFVRKYNLNYLTDLRKIDNIYTFCILRDPVKRFLSSISETIYRATMPCIKQYGFAGNIPLERDIYFELAESSIKPNEFIDTILDIIYRYGFFDAHHAPQSFFIEQLPPDVKCNMFAIDSLETLNNVLDQQIPHKSKSNFTNIRSSRASLLRRLSNPRFLARAIFNPLQIYNSRLKTLCYPRNHFIHRLIDYDNSSKRSVLFDDVYSVNIALLNSRLSRFYKELCESVTNEHLLKLNQLYKEDMVIYDRIK